MSYKYRQGETPDHVNSEDSNDTIPTIAISDTTDLKKRISAASDTLKSVAETPTGKGRKYTVNDLTEIEDRTQKIGKMQDSLDTARKKKVKQ